MRQEKIGFGVIIRMLVSLLPILFGMPMIAVLLCSYNLVMSYVVFGPVTGIVSALCAAAISMFMYGFSFGGGAELTGLFMALISILCAIGCMQCIRRKIDFFRGVWISSFCSLVPFYSWLHFVSAQSGMSVAAFFSTNTEEIIKMASSIAAEQLPRGMDASIIPFDKIAEYAGAFAGILVPAVVIIFSVFIGYVTMWAVNAQLRRTGYPIRHKFSNIRIPLPMILMLFAGVFLCYINVSREITAMALNVCVVIGVFCLTAGISFVEYYLQKSNIKTFFRVLIHLFILNSTLGMAAVSPLVNAYTGYLGLAIVDSLFNFRKIGKGREKEENDNETEK